MTSSCSLALTNFYIPAREFQECNSWRVWWYDMYVFCYWCFIPLAINKHRVVPYQRNWPVIRWYAGKILMINHTHSTGKKRHWYPFSTYELTSCENPLNKMCHFGWISIQPFKKKREMGRQQQNHYWLMHHRRHIRNVDQHCNCWWLMV